MFIYLSYWFLSTDQCKASAYLPFDVDLEDKSGSNTAVLVRNVTMTPYGSAHFTGNSALTMYKYADVNLGDKLLISFKFKFDRWPDSLDHAGKEISSFESRFMTNLSISVLLCRKSNFRQSGGF